MADSSESQSTFGTVAAIYGVPALIAAFIFSSDVALMSGVERALLWMATMLATGILVCAFELTLPAWARGILCAVALGLLGLFFAKLSRPAWEAAEANDRRCLAIQRDMLSAHPRRADSPELFQALGCRPQGEGSVYALRPPSAPQRAARHAKP